MKIYHYHPDTAEYIGFGMADKDPLVDDNWLIPAHATTIAPPKTDIGEVAVFDIGLGGWTVVIAPPAAIEDLPPDQQKDPRVLRAAAYADLINGSDRLFMEALRKRAAGDEQGAIEAEQSGLNRVAEIQLTYPITNEVDLDG